MLLELADVQMRRMPFHPLEEFDRRAVAMAEAEAGLTLQHRCLQAIPELVDGHVEGQFAASPPLMLVFAQFSKDRGIEALPIAFDERFPFHFQPERVAHEARVNFDDGHDAVDRIPWQQPTRFALQLQRRTQWFRNPGNVVQCLGQQRPEHLWHGLGRFTQHAAVGLILLLLFSEVADHQGCRDATGFAGWPSLRVQVRSLPLPVNRQQRDFARPHTGHDQGAHRCKP